jgi:DinB superfamily
LEVAEKYKLATEEFLNVVDSLSSGDLDKSDSEGWTPRQVIHHMADSEAQSYARLRRLIAEPGTSIQGYDEAIWAENSTLGYKTENVKTSISVIKAVRQASYELLLRISEADLEKTGMHTESGEYSVKRWIEAYTRHPKDHANQIREQIK